MTKILAGGALLLTGVLAAGCGGGNKKAEETSAAAPAAAPAVTRVDPATAARVTGKVRFAGKTPPRSVIRMDEEAACVRLHKTPVYAEEVAVNPDGTLANVFVYVKTGLEGKTFETPKEPVQIDQRGCLYSPHVFGIQAGQTLDVLNSDPVSHNIHPIPKDNREWNQQQAPEAPKLERQFARPEVMIPVKCNVHNWMRAYIGVVPHPYFAVTGADGSFALKNLPPGEYTLEAWQEKFGAQEQKVTLAAAAAQTIEFTFK